MKNNKKNKEVIEKIKKIYEKAESSKSINSLEEANIFFEKVQDLLFKYNLSLNDVLNFKTEEEIEYLKGKEDGIEYYHNVNEGFQWEPALMHSIASNNNCYSYKTYYSNQSWCAKNNMFPYITLIGRPSDKENCKYFFEIAKNILRKLSVSSYEERVSYLRNRYSVIASSAEEAYSKLLESLVGDSVIGATSDTINLMQALVKLSYSDKKALFMPKSYKEEDLKKSQVWYLKDLVKCNLIKYRTTYIQSFLIGAAYGVESALKKSKVDFISTLKFEEKEQVNAIILAQQNKLKLFVDENVGKLKTTNNYIGDSFAFSDGVDKGSNISLSKGLNKENGNFVKALK